MGITVDAAWKILFDKHNIPEAVHKDGLFYITSKEINTVKEARLMAKFDQTVLLPKVFSKYKLSILPITRGEYVIGSFATHTDIIYSDIKPIPVQDPQLESLDYTNLYSESSALLFAYNSGIIADFLGATKVNFTINGRMSSGSFSYTIADIHDTEKSYNLSVMNAQIEIDAGYETPEVLCICEAKNIASEEILIRQLYYPYRLWKSKIAKPVIPIFMVYSNDVFYLFRYGFEDDNFYNSIRLLEQKSYMLDDGDIQMNELIDLWKSITPIAEPDVTFPQANSFGRVVDILSVLFERDLTREEVALQYEFVDRQTNYYISACEYLGLVQRSQNMDKERIYCLNSTAKKIMRMRHKAKYLQLFKLVLERPVFNKVFELSINSGEVPSENEVRQIMSESNLLINDTTIKRRSSTVRGWIEWMFEQAVAE